MKQILYCFLIAFFAISCEKDDSSLESDSLSSVSESSSSGIYKENDYLVFPSFSALDSVRNLIMNDSIEAQEEWEEQYGFTSAKTYRNSLSTIFDSVTDSASYDAFASEYADNSYFSATDSSIVYPFFNDSWACVLNKNGIVKVGDHILGFTSENEYSISDADDYASLKSAVRGGTVSSSVSTYCLSAKSSVATRTTDYWSQPVFWGNTSTSKYQSGRNRLTVAFQTVPIVVDGVLEGVYLDVYYHGQKQGIGLHDKKTHFFKRVRKRIRIGGNNLYDSSNYIFPETTIGRDDSFVKVNEGEAANYYVTYYTYDYPEGNYLTNFDEDSEEGTSDGLCSPAVHNFYIDVYSIKEGKHAFPLKYPATQPDLDDYVSYTSSSELDDL